MTTTILWLAAIFLGDVICHGIVIVLAALGQSPHLDPAWAANVRRRPVSS